MEINAHVSVKGGKYNAYNSHGYFDDIGLNNYPHLMRFPEGNCCC